MKKITIKRKAVFALCALLFACISYAQLPAFTLNATPTPQTCSGNGSVSFTTSGTQPGATMSYELYLLPNTTTPLTLPTASPVTSLSAGNYLLVATQILGAQSSTSNANFTILNQVILLEYTLVQTKVRCGSDGKITANVTSGTAVSYQIISGPVTTPVQASNVFNNLPVGSYLVRVLDNCGDALVVSIQVTAATPQVIIDPVGFPSAQLPSCNTINISHFFASTTGNEIFFPLTFEFTVFPPGGGAPTVLTQTVATGNNVNNTILQAIPFYNNQAYTYNLKVTDACGNIFTRNNNAVNKAFDIAVTPDIAGCSDNLFSIVPSNYVGPYTITFLTAPAGFVPAAYNPQHPTFNIDEVIYGEEGNSVPEGSYSVQVTDACGRTVTKTFEVDDPPVVPQATAEADGCTGEGTISIVIPGRTIILITMTAAPAAFGQALPLNVTVNVGPLGFEMGGLPLGDYTFVMTDNCGQVHTVNATIEPAPGDPELNVLQRPGCEVGEGSVRIRNLDGGLTQVTITAAPAGFTETLPYNASANIAANGMFFMNSLPQGNYTISIVDECGVGETDVFTVTGYAVTNNNIEIVENCQSFDLLLQHTSNGNYIQSFWLQSQDPLTGAWGHPGTGVDYVEGTLPTAGNSVLLTNNFNNIDNQFTGVFRVLKVFHVYSNGSTLNHRCISEIHNFEFSGRPVIHSVYAFPCANGLSEVAVNATGIAPLTYEMVKKNNIDISIVNGTSNIFSNLESATYTVRVYDNCGSWSNFDFDINELDPLVIEAMNLCEGEDGLLSIPAFTFLNYEWYETSTPGTILATTNTLSLSPFDSDIHPGNYAVRIFSANPASCINNIIEYEVLPNNIPNAGIDDTVIVCNDGDQLDLTNYLAAGHDAGGTWTDTNATGALTGDLLDTNGLVAGIYQFTYSVTGDCNLTDDAVISLDLRTRPAAPVAALVPQLCEGGNIQLSVDPVTNAVYEWAGPNNFTSADQNPLITSAGIAANGQYSVKVSVNGCESPVSLVNVSVNAIPDFTVTGNSALCTGQSTDLTVVPENFDAALANYQWYHEGVLQPANTAAVTVSETGVYEVIVTNGICAAVPQQFTVSQNTAAFDIVLENGCRDFEYYISVVNADDLTGAAYEWTGPDFFSATGFEVKITDMATGIYTVTVTNSEGCTATEDVLVENTMCRIPKGISPGDAANNNKFDLSNLDVQHLQIFNRFGLEVYHKADYIDEWEGQSDKGDLPTGTYYYVVSLSTGKRVTGWVYLQRQN